MAQTRSHSVLAATKTVGFIKVDGLSFTDAKELRQWIRNEFGGYVIIL
jgi:ribosomal protein L10